MSRNNTRNLGANSPRLFTPSVTQNIQEGSSDAVIFETQDGTITNDTSLGVSSSFKYDPQGTGLRSTQQLNVDWDVFANHTFFNSAQVKTNVAFQKILNEFPFDGNRQTVEVFLDRLTGFERYVYDIFPKHKDYLFFSGTQATEAFGGTAVIAKDIAGAAYPDASVKHTGETVLNPGIKPMTIEFQIYIPPISSSNQTILDKHVENSVADFQGFHVSLNSTGSLTTGSLSMRVMSGSVVDTVTVEVAKGEWNHVAWVWDRNVSEQKISGFVNQRFFASSSQPIEFGTIEASVPDLLIGSGSAVTGYFTPETTFSGALDELRIWHSVRSAKQRANYEKKAVFADNNLKLYYKFNEPENIGSDIVIDHSSNSVHGRLSTSALTLGVRNIASASVAGPSPMTFEKLSLSPVLFPDFQDVIDLQTSFLEDASEYDKINPNLITRLIPRHYLLQGQAFDGLETEEGAIVDSLSSGTDPRSSRLGGTQALLLLLYTWAKFFDEMKLYTQAFANLDFSSYDFEDTVPDEFLQDMAARHGLTLPPLFQGSSIEQFVDAENVGSSIGTNNMTLKAVQNQIWRRILVNMQDFIKSKGTMHSVKSFIRTVGIDPDSTFRIREYGGPTRRALDFVRDKKTEISTMLNFVSGGLVQSPFLSSPRVEPGYPSPSLAGDEANALLTSGSFTFEGSYRFNTNIPTGTSQSLVRIQTTGSAASISSLGVDTFVAANLVSVKGGSTTLFLSLQDTIPVLQLALTGADLYDGDVWYASFGRRRSDDNELNDTNISSSYFLRLAKQQNGEILEQYTTASFYQEVSVGTDNLFQVTSSVYNPSGSFLVFGSGSIQEATLADAFLNSTASSPSTARASDFTGKITQIRYWSKFLTEDEWPEHVRNYRSVGVQDPKVNFNFDTTNSGSWERLRIDASTDQIVTASDASGNIFLTDFTQNNFTLTGSGFLATSSVIVPQRFHFSYISPKYDQASTTEKVRIRGFQNFEKVQATPWAQSAPVTDIVRSEAPTDNDRFTIDFSVVDALDQDIITIFSTLDELDNAIGSPELVFSPDYPDLANLRKIYFNKLTGQMNLKGFFEFFKWFDTNIGTFVAQLLPRKTKFLGTNFVIESHMLERAKAEYQFEDIYLGDANRSGLKDTILLQLITGQFNRY